MSSTSVGQLAENVTEVVGEVLSTGKERASDAATHLPEVAESVSKLARASAETVADLATTAIALTPFVHRQSRGRRTNWWLVARARARRPCRVRNLEALAGLRHGSGRHLPARQQRLQLRSVDLGGYRLGRPRFLRRSSVLSSDRRSADVLRRRAHDELGGKRDLFVHVALRCVAVSGRAQPRIRGSTRPDREMGASAPRYRWRGSLRHRLGKQPSRRPPRTPSRANNRVHAPARRFALLGRLSVSGVRRVRLPTPPPASCPG